MNRTEAAVLDSQQRAEAREQARTRNGIVPTKKKSIAVCTPTLGKISMHWHVSMIDLIWPMNCARGFLPMLDRQGDEIAEMRNRLVKLALDSSQQAGVDLEYLFWVDDDVIIQRPCLLALAAHDVDIASGVYFSKSDPAEPLIFSGPSSGTVKFNPDTVFESWGWANGLSLVRASVYRRMMDELDLGVDKYGNPWFYKQPPFGLTEAGISLGGTEDFHFFDNCSKLGYRPIVDCTKHAFGWHYDMNEGVGYPRKQWDQFLRREPIVWPQKEGGEVVWG